jgi:hypothetical protein
MKKHIKYIDKSAMVALKLSELSQNFNISTISRIVAEENGNVERASGL